MSSPTLSTRQRLIDSALALFLAQGVSSTTTRKIAELADVNEVTLFRQFGNKYGLLLAVLEESEAFQQLGESLVGQISPSETIDQVFKSYASKSLHSLERVPELIRSVVGEADQYPTENRRALGKRLAEANRHAAQYFASVMGPEQLNLSAEALASLLNGMLLGYVVLEFTSEFHGLWADQADFLENLVRLFLHGAVASSDTLFKPDIEREGSPLSQRIILVEPVSDLPADWVHEMLRRARKLGTLDYALAYVLFAAGLSTVEVTGLLRSQQISDAHQHVLQVNVPNPRSVPVNQWILGKRYGSYTANPLTRYLKSRKDSHAALFLDGMGQPISETEILARWQIWVEALPEQPLFAIAQTQQTWCIDMLLRGISLENLSILTGWTLPQLQPYAQRAREISALEQATRLDQKPSGSVAKS